MWVMPMTKDISLYKTDFKNTEYDRRVDIDKSIALIDKLEKERSLDLEEYKYLLENLNEEVFDYISKKARILGDENYGKDIYLRGLIEISNICKNDCYYCGIRHSNKNCDRYRLSDEEIIECADEGYRLGYRTFVMQGGEDGKFESDYICSIVRKVKEKYKDVAVTLSLGEYERDEYQRMFDAGADRYLLRHETADKEHYEKLHPKQMSFEHRMKCLQDLKDIGFQVGCGFMVGSPYQTSTTLAKDLKFIEEFGPHMCGIGPFIPHHDTAFKDEKSGSIQMTLFLIAILRIMRPKMLIPATTSLSTLDNLGREKGILAGANVVMPNLSPLKTRKKYELYDGKVCTGDEAAHCIGCITNRINNIGYEVAKVRGDSKCLSTM